MKKTLQTMPKTLALLIFAWMLAAVCFASPLTLESAQTAGEIVNDAENPSLLASTVPAANIAPGLNVYTGTANALTFDSAADADCFAASAGMTLSVASTTTIYGTANNALQLACPSNSANAGIWPNLTTALGAAIDRPAALLFDFHDEYLAFQWAAGKTGWINGGWDASKNHNVRKTNVNNFAPLAEMKISGYIVAQTWRVYNNYLDNIALIPYYTITYDMPIGTEDVTVYYLADAVSSDRGTDIALDVSPDGTISGLPGSYVIDSAVTVDADGFLGWSTDPDATAPMTSVTLANEDVTLYPVIEGGYTPEVNKDDAPAAYSEDYGQLLYFNNFDTSDFPNLVNLTVTGASTTVANGYVCARGAASGAAGWSEYPFNSASGGLRLISTSGEQYAWTYTSGETVAGKLVLLADVYAESDVTLATFFVNGKTTYGTTESGWGNPNARLVWGGASTKVNAGTWTTDLTPAYTYSESLYKQWGLGMINNATPLYFKNIRIYAKEPTNALWLTDENGGSRVYEIANGDTYTFPASFGTETVEAWTDGSTICYAGETKAVSDVAAKTFRAVSVLDPAAYTTYFALSDDAYDVIRGARVFYKAFDTGETNAIAALKTASVGASEQKDGKTGVHGVQGYGTNEPYTFVLSVLPSTGGYAGSWTYTDSAKTPVLGRVTLASELFIDSDSGAVTDFGGADWLWDQNLSIRSAWTTFAGTRTVNSAVKGAWGLGTTNGKDIALYRDIAVWVIPSNGLFLADEDGEERLLAVVAGRDFRFPDTFGESAVRYWSDGETVYEANADVSLSDVAGKTFTAFSPEPEVLATASIRVKGPYNGMRFASFVSLEKRAVADSYGFIVAKSDSLAGDDELVFDEDRNEKGTNDYGVTYISGESYNKASGIDLVYATDGAAFGSAGKGTGFYFTGVLYNIPVDAYTTNFTLRPYLVMNGSVFYGDTVTRSLYGVADAVKAENYPGLDEEGVAYVDSILAQAN